MEFILEMVVKVWDGDKMPLEWSEGRLEALFKKGKKTLAASYRPLSIGSHAGPAVGFQFSRRKKKPNKNFRPSGEKNARNRDQ